MSNSVECNFNELTYYQKNSDVILNRAKGYYENDKERFREQARDEYRKKKRKDRIWKKQIPQYMSEEKEQRLKEYQKNYRGPKKSQYNNE